MNAQQLEDAAVRLEEAFVPAVKRLRGRSSMEVVLDSLFKGEDDAGQFVVRFEVTVTRCARGLREQLRCKSIGCLTTLEPQSRFGDKLREI